MARVRIDTLLVERGLFPSRERARSALIAGHVRVAGSVVTKAGQQVEQDSEIHVTAQQRFVSRGGEKLDGALSDFRIPVEGRRATDVGASTGGFTDCLLQRGAASVAAIDVGYGQLAWSLRTDPRVTVFERTNIRSVDVEEVGGPFGIVVVDVSFISLRTVLPHLLPLMAPEGDLLVLVKPQFEAGKSRVGKRGVVRDATVHIEILDDLAKAVATSGLVVRGLSYSPITGPEGNIEFWLWAAHAGPECDSTASAVVAAAHEKHGG